MYNTIATSPGDKTVSQDGTSAHNLVATTAGRHCCGNSVSFPDC